jgi:hypothetical protein
MLFVDNDSSAAIGALRGVPAWTSHFEREPQSTERAANLDSGFC